MDLCLDGQWSIMTWFNNAIFLSNATLNNSTLGTYREGIPSTTGHCAERRGKDCDAYFAQHGAKREPSPTAVLVLPSYTAGQGRCYVNPAAALVWQHAFTYTMHYPKCMPGATLLPRCRRFTLPGGEAPAGGFLCSLPSSGNKYSGQQQMTVSQSQRASWSSSFPSPIGHAPETDM